MERKSLVVVFSILIVLLAAQEVVVKTEAKTCQKPSKYYSGLCISWTIDNPRRCFARCRGGEGLLSGFCRDDLKCVCTYDC